MKEGGRKEEGRMKEGGRKEEGRRKEGGRKERVVVCTLGQAGSGIS